ncbi:MAG: hypothetical protein ACE361_10370, partial [Aureliella sp.]
REVAKAQRRKGLPILDIDFVCDFASLRLCVEEFCGKFAASTHEISCCLVPGLAVAEAILKREVAKAQRRKGLPILDIDFVCDFASLRLCVEEFCGKLAAGTHEISCCLVPGLAVAEAILKREGEREGERAKDS